MRLHRLISGTWGFIQFEGIERVNIKHNIRIFDRNDAVLFQASDTQNQ